MKTNKNGVKLLAATMVFAMVLVAGFVVIDNSDESEAAYVETSIPGTPDEITADFTVGSGKTYLIKEDVKVTASTNATTLYILDGKTVTIMGVGSSGKITIFAAKAVGNEYKYGGTGDNKLEITPTETTTELTVTASLVSTESKLVLGGETTGGSETITATGNGVVVSDSGLTATTVFSTEGITYGIKDAMSAENKVVYYPAGKSLSVSGKEPSEGNRTIVVKNGSLSLTKVYDANNKYTTKVTLKDVVSAAGITVTTTATAAPTIDGEYTAGSITVDSGKMTIASSLAPTSLAKLNAFASGVVANGVILGANVSDVTVTNGLWVYGNVASNQTVTLSNGKSVTTVNATVTALSVNKDANTVVGVFSVNGSAAIAAVISQESKLTLPASVAAEVTLISGAFADTAATTVAVNGILTVSDNATLTIGNAMTVAGKMNVYGTVTSGSTLTIGVVCVDAGSTPGEFRAFDGSAINQKITVGLDATTQNKAVKGIIEMASGTKTVSGQVMGDETYNQSQNVVVDGFYDIMNNSKVEVKGSLEIPEGAIVTIEKGSKLWVIGVTSVVKIAGKLVVEDGAEFDVQSAKSVSITGTVESEGDLKFASLAAKIENGGSVTSSKNFTCSAITVGAGSELKIGGTTVSAVAITNLGNVVFDEVAFGAKVTVSNVADGATVEIVSFTAGKFASTDTNLVTINDAGLEYNKQSITGTNAVLFKNNSTADTTKVGYSGMTITSSVVLEGTNNTPVKKLDVAGSVDIYNPGNVETGVTMNAETTGDSVTVSDALTLNDKVLLTVASGKLLVSGKLTAITDSTAQIVATGKITVIGVMTLKTDVATPANINAAYYKATDANNANTHVYTILAKAIEAGATDIKTFGDITVLDDVDIPKGTTVAVSNGGSFVIGSDDKRDVTVKVADGATMKGAPVTVKGTFEFENKKNNRLASVASDVSVIGDVAAKYTNIYTALGSAGEGDVITITSQNAVVINADIIIKEGVTLSVPAGKSVTVNKNVTVTVDGTVDAYSGFGSENGFDVKESADESAIVVNGKFMTGEAGGATAAQTKYQSNGAYYVVTGTSGTYTCIAPVAIAAADAQDAGTISLYGENKFDSVKFEATQAKPVTIDMVAGTVTNPTVVAGDIEISNYVTVNNVNTARFDGKITSAVGEIDIVNMTGFSIRSLMNADNSEILGVYMTPVQASAAIGAPEQKFVIASGIVTVPGTSTNSNAFNASGANLSIAADATLNVTGQMTVDKMSVDGTLSVANQGSFTVSEYLEVVGTFAIVEADTVKGTAAGTASIPVMYVGTTKKATTGADATVSASTIANLETVYVAAGATVSEDVLKAVQKSTAFNVDGVLYMTVYTKGTVKIDSIATPEIDGAEVENWQVTKDGKLVDVKDETVGSVASVSGKMNFDVYKVVFVVDSGITDVYVDGVLVDSEGLSNSSLTTCVSVGEHKITYKVKSGMGGDIKITFNGKDLTDGKFTITKDMAFQDDDGKVIGYKAVISGVEVVDSGSSSKNDDGMGITDILLIVLVILAAILVVVVAIRMMRS